MPTDRKVLSILLLWVSLHLMQQTHGECCRRLYPCCQCPSLPIGWVEPTVCGDCRQGRPFCGIGDCNIFGCNCDGGCRRGKCGNYNREYLTTVNDIINNCDENGDGYISLTELEIWSKKGGIIDNMYANITDAFNSMDTNRDGRLSSNEIDN